MDLCSLLQVRPGSAISVLQNADGPQGGSPMIPAGSIGAAAPFQQWAAGSLEEDQPSQYYTKNGYVSTWIEYQEILNNSGIKKSVYPAYVQPINSEPYGTLLSKHGHISGNNEKPSNDDCGAIFRKIQCSTNPLHHPSFRHVRCNDQGCPVCYVKFASRLADSVTERVQGFKTVYRNSKPYHLILWGAKVEGADRPYADLRSSFREAKRLLEIMGATSSVVWYHPYRIKPELKDLLRHYRRAHKLDGRAGFWKLAHDDVLELGGVERYIVYAPHWHAIATGFLMKSSEFCDVTGGAGYKKRRYLEYEKDVHEVAHYISTHACMEFGKSSVRYYGVISYRMMAREMVEEKIKDVLCQDCKSHMEEYEVDEKGEYYRDSPRGPIIRKSKDKVTEKIKYYLYWKKGQPKPDMGDHSQCLITRFCDR